MTDASNNAAVVRSTFLKIDPAVTLRAVDTLNLRAHAKVSAVVGVPLRQLQQRRDVTAFATTAPLAALRGLLEVLAVDPLEKTITLLGDHSESPSFDQLSVAIDQLLATGSTVDDVLAVLAYAISESFPAAAHCRRLFDEREAFALPALPEIAVPSVLAPVREVSVEVREQRRLRREEEKRRKKVASSTRPPRPTKSKSSTLRPNVVATSPRVEAAPLPEVRRRLLLTPLETMRFDETHALVGAVVLVDVPYDALDPEEAERTSKERPALIVAASRDELLVRALYSHASPARALFHPWRRLGLDHASYLGVERLALPYDQTGRLVHLGELTTREWNSLS